MRIHLVLIAIKVFLCWSIFMCIQWITMQSEHKKVVIQDCRQLQWRRKRPLQKESYKIWRKTDKIKYWLESIFRDNYALVLVLILISICVCVSVCCIFAALWRQQRQTLFGIARSAMKCTRKRISFALKRVLKLYGVFICCHLQTQHYEFQLLLSNCSASMAVFVCDVILCGCGLFYICISESETEMR